MLLNLMPYLVNASCIPLDYKYWIRLASTFCTQMLSLVVFAGEDPYVYGYFYPATGGDEYKLSSL